jgi:hypothetical protein
MDLSKALLGEEDFEGIIDEINIEWSKTAKTSEKLKVLVKAL